MISVACLPDWAAAAARVGGTGVQVTQLNVVDNHDESWAIAFSKV